MFTTDLPEKKNKKKIWEYFEELHTEKLENLNEMDNSMEKGGLPDWIMKKIENLGYL